MNLSRRQFGHSCVSAAGLFFFANQSLASEKNQFEEIYDFIIVGGGGSGLSAACAATEKKMSTIVLEKMAFLGGSSIMCGGSIAVAGTSKQRQDGIEDSKEAFFLDLKKAGGGLSDDAVLRKMVVALLEQYEFMTQTLGLKPDQIVQHPGMSKPRSHHFVPTEVIKALENYARSHGAVIKTSSPVTRLIWNENHTKVIGVLATIKGKETYIGAKKGVLLSAGGFANNPKILGKYRPVLAHATSISSKGATGDGLIMAQSAGGDILDTAYISATYGFKLNPHTIEDLFQAYWRGAVIVNAEGKRFINESLSYHTLADKALEQPKSASFMIMDRKVVEDDLKQSPRKVIPRLILESKELPSFIFSGKTVREAAEKAGLDADSVEATIKKYNSDIQKNGVDSEFGRATLNGDKGKPFPIETGPFYVFPATSVLLQTPCGVRINEKAQVIDVYGEPVPGLYAAGEMTGGIHGAKVLSATAFAKALAFGRVAAQSVAKN